MDVQKLKEIFAKVFDVDPSSVTKEMSQEKTEKWDSFNHLLLISEAEKVFEIEFTVQEVINIETFRDLKRIIENKL